MGKTYIETIKYLILADFKIVGLVERPDVIGAIFGQSEGLLGSELDIKELQQNGKIGRIEIEYNHANNKTSGILKLPCSVSMVETAIIAASIETIEKVGPCDASFVIKEIQDTRGLKRRQIKERAIDLLGRLMQEQIPDTRELMEEITDTFKTKEIISYGPDKLAAGPTLESSKNIVIVEGRADVINLLKYGFTNIIATGGARIPRSLADICKDKNVTLFLDGDHGGDIQQSQLLKAIKVDFIARAPDGKEVEELTQKEINQALRKKIKASYIISSKPSHSNIKVNIKKTRFSVTNEHKVVPKLFKENKAIRNNNNSFKPITEEKNVISNDSFDHMLSEIPNIERVDVDKNSFSNINRSRDNNSNRNNTKFDRNTSFDKDKFKRPVTKENIVKQISSFLNKEDSFNKTNENKVSQTVIESKNYPKKEDLEVKTQSVNFRKDKINTQKQLKDAKADVLKVNKQVKLVSKDKNKDNDDIKNKSSELKDNVETKENISKETKPIETKPIELPKITNDLKKKLLTIVNEIKDNKQSRILNEKFRRIANSKNTDLENKLLNFKPNKMYAVVTSLELTPTSKIIDYSIEKGARFLVSRNTNDVKNPKIHILSYEDLKN